MARYHDLTLLFEAAIDVLSAIVQRESLSSATINQWVRKDLGVPVLTLKWQAADSIERNLHIGVVDEPQEALAEIEVNAWKDLEKRPKRQGRPQTFRRMLSEGIGTIRHIDQHDRQWLLGELNALLWQAYGVVSRVGPDELREETRLDPEGGDPGPIKVEDWLGE